MTTLDSEALAYRTHLPEMVVTHAGKYVVIKGTEPRHFSETYEDALEWAYETFGLDRFVVKKVAPQDQEVAHFTRDLGPCRP